MNASCANLGPGMRRLLLFCGPMNAAGAVCFSPPYPDTRLAFGMPEPDPYYLWVLSSWIAAFGVAYFHQGWTGRPNRSVLALGAWGKLVFSALLMQMAATGELKPFAAIAAIPDLILGVVFAAWLWRTRTVASFSCGEVGA